jgi:AraC-like DNA-binding protein
MRAAVSDANPIPVALERHYTVAEVAQLWGVSKNTVRRVFKDVPGVLRIGSRKPRTRRYITLSIPERVLTATHAALTK